MIKLILVGVLLSSVYGHLVFAQGADDGGHVLHKAFNSSKPFVVDSSRTLTEMMTEADERMMSGMMHAPVTNNPDVDFVTSMIPHHQGAIDMTRVLLLYDVADPAIRNLEYGVITAQQKEIKQMKDWLKTQAGKTLPQLTGAKEQKYRNKINDIMETMHKNMAVNFNEQNPALGYVTMMIPHHQAAIDLARHYLTVAKDPQMINLAHGIITEQEHEIKLMNQWLTKNKHVAQ